MTTYTLLLCRPNNFPSTDVHSVGILEVCLCITSPDSHHTLHKLVVYAMHVIPPGIHYTTNMLRDCTVCIAHNCSCNEDPILNMRISVSLLQFPSTSSHVSILQSNNSFGRKCLHSLISGSCLSASPFPYSHLIEYSKYCLVVDMDYL